MQWIGLTNYKTQIMKNTVKLLSEKVNKKYFSYAYVIVLLIGLFLIFFQVLNTETSFGVKIDVSIRLALFLINISIPYILWQHYYSNLLFNHQKVKDNRRYIWKSRKIIFRDRTRYSILYFIFAIGIAIFSLKIFGKSYVEEAFSLIFAGIITLLFPLIILYMYSAKCVRHSNKNMSNDKIYSPEYRQRIQDEKTIRELELIENRTYNQKSIIIEEVDCFDITTIKAIYEICNDIIFHENNINRFYNILNLKSNDSFQIKIKGRFLSLIYLLQSTVRDHREWDKEILQVFNINYEKEYMRNRKKYIDDDIYFDNKMDLLDKIRHIKETKS